MREPKVGDIIIAPPSVTGKCCGLEGTFAKSIFEYGKGKIRVARIATKDTNHPHRFIYEYKLAGDKWGSSNFWICAKNWPKSTFVYEDEVPYICQNCLTNEWNEKENYICIHCKYDFFSNFYSKIKV